MQFRAIIKPKPGDEGKTEIKIECYYDRRYRYRNTGVYIEPKYWQEDKSLVSTKHPQSATINALVKQKVLELEKIAVGYEQRGGVFDFNALRTLTGDKDKQSFCDFIEEMIKTEKKLDGKSIQKYMYNRDVVQKCIGDVATDDLTEKHIEKLKTYFEDNFADSTVARLHIFVQKYVKKAIKKRILQNNPYDLVEIERFEPVSKNTYHTMKELETIEALDLKGTMELIRDRYLFSCYTGLRISDNLALKRAWINETPDGLVIDMHTIKGYGSDVVIPLGLMFDGKADKIARKWLKKADCDTLFPVVSNEYIRTSLGLIKEMAEIDKHITFHVARHTCASLLADISQNPYLIMYILGHKDIKTSMTYIHRSPETIKKQFRGLTDWREKAR